MGKLACTNAQTSDGQAGMSMEGISPECEYRRRLRERVSAEQSTFMHGGAPQSGA